MPALPDLNPDANDAERVARVQREGVETRKTLCASCDIACSVVTEVKDGQVTRVRAQ